MNISSVACYDCAVPIVKGPTRKAAGQSLFAATAAAALAVGCAWTLYAKIFAADPYPQLDNSSFDSRWVDVTPQKAARPKDASAARLELSETVVPETLIDAETRLSFADRFAASLAEGVAPAVAPQPEPLKLTESSRAPTEKNGEALKQKVTAVIRYVSVPSAAQTEPGKSEAAKPREAGVRFVSASPAAQADDPPKSGVDKIRDMAQRAKIAIFGIGSADRQAIVEKLWGKGSAPRNPVLAYASADASVTGSITHEQNPMLGGAPPYDRDTAVYDIAAHTVYLPDGSKLEAHSGLGSNMDDPHSARIRMRGVTPPHIYTLKPRESLFHGVAALRLTPVGGEDAIFGREGLLAHSFMLGPNGASNGCVSFRDYDAFLSAYHNMGVRKLAVLARVD